MQATFLSCPSKMVAEQDAWKLNGEVVSAQKNVVTLSYALNVSRVVFFIGLQM